MQISSFVYKGKEYQVDKVVELDPEDGERCLQVTTKDNKKFKLTFNEYLYKWVIAELDD